MFSLLFVPFHQKRTFQYRTSSGKIKTKVVDKQFLIGVLEDHRNRKAQQEREEPAAKRKKYQQQMSEDNESESESNEDGKMLCIYMI